MGQQRRDQLRMLGSVCRDLLQLCGSRGEVSDLREQGIHRRARRPIGVVRCKLVVHCSP
jgi:hypothetical protein